MLVEVLLACLAEYIWWGETLKRRLFREKAWEVGWSATRLGRGRGVWYGVKWCVGWLMVAAQSRRERGREGSVRQDWLLAERAECEAEEPRDLRELGVHGNDAVAVQGSDAAGNQLQVRMGRRLGGVTEFWLLLRLMPSEEGGEELLLVHPLHPTATMTGGEESGWSCGGLKIELVEACRRWQVSYRGWLRSGFTSSFPVIHQCSFDFQQVGKQQERGSYLCHLRFSVRSVRRQMIQMLF